MSYVPPSPTLVPADNKSDYLDSPLGVPDDTSSYDPARPPIDYSSFRSFKTTAWRRFCSLWTKRFILSLIAGQVVSLCITCTNVTTTELVMRNWSLPTTQTWFLCVLAVSLPTAYR